MTAAGRGHGQKRERLEDRALAALLSEPTIEAAAKRADVAESTLLRWLQEPAFKARYRAARRSIVESAVGRLQTVATKAIEALELASEVAASREKGGRR